MDIGPGDWVECVDDGWRPNETESNYIKSGNIYCVTAVIPAETYVEPDVDGIELSQFQVVQDDGYLPSFSIDRFRPIYRPKSDLIEQLKKPMRVEFHVGELYR